MAHETFMFILASSLLVFLGDEQMHYTSIMLQEDALITVFKKYIYGTDIIPSLCR